MSEAYSIEVGDELAGVVVREESKRYFTFITDVAAFSSLNGCVFPGPLDAERAARAQVAQKLGRKQRATPPLRSLERVGE